MAKEFYSKLAGVTYKNDDSSSRQDIIESDARQGMQLILRREPHNKFDNNAIAVYIIAKSCTGSAERQIGYIESRTASELAPLMDKGIKVTAVISSLSGGDGPKNTGVNVTISY